MNDYTRKDYERMQREKQLVSKYNQTPVINRPKGLWMISTVSSHTKHKLDIVDAVLGVLMAGGIIIASIIIG